MKVTEKVHYVYWYHLKDHTDINTQGYVGVTVDLIHRDACHKRYGKSYGLILRNAFNKYGEDNIYKDIVFTGSYVEAYALELQLRPAKEIGWNIAVGGGTPPDCSGRVHSEETKRKIAESNRITRKGRYYPNHFKGKTGRYTDEQRKHIGSFHKGKVITESAKLSMIPKLSGSNSTHAKQIHLCHKDDKTRVFTFGCIKEAAEKTGINYQTLRSQWRYKRTTYNRKGWRILYNNKVEG